METVDDVCSCLSILSKDKSVNSLQLILFFNSNKFFRASKNFHSNSTN